MEGRGHGDDNGMMAKELEQPLIHQQDQPNQHNRHNQRNQHLSDGHNDGYYDASSDYDESEYRHRILDRDGTFSQSRGRWSVANNTDSNRSSQARQARQRRGGAGAGGAGSNPDFSEPVFARPVPRRPLPEKPPSKWTSFWRCLCRPFCRCCCSILPPSWLPWGYYCSPCCLTSACCPIPHQSSNKASTLRRCWDDWFHNLSHTPTCFLMLGIFVAYFITIVIFAGFYWSVNKLGRFVEEEDSAGGGGGGGDPTDYTGAEFLNGSNGVGDVQVESSYCGMDINSWMEAMYFSLSTMATIGYGVSDYYFGECWIPFLLVLLQVFAGLLFSCLAIGLLFQRMSRGQKRGRTIVFSDVAVVRKVGGIWYWMFRVGELRKRHVIGAKVRVFCVRHERCPIDDARSSNVTLETAYYVSHPLPLLNGSGSGSGGSNASSSSAALADEERRSVSSSTHRSDCVFEQSILMGLPHVVVHRMDHSSPMMPPRPLWYDEAGVPHGPSVPEVGQAKMAPMTPAASSTAQTSSEVSNESLMEDGSVDRSAESTNPSTLLAASGETNETNTNSNDDGRNEYYPTQKEITHFLRDRQAEIIVFLEGTCEVTGMAVQARHSYRVEDIAFHRTFAPCAFRSLDASLDSSYGDSSSSSSEGRRRGRGRYNALEIDFCQFHDLIPAPLDCASCPYVPPSSLPA